MSKRSNAPLGDVVLNDVAPESVDPEDVHAALESDRAVVRQRGAQVCATLAGDDVERVRPFVEELGTVLHDDNAGVVQTAASALQEIAAADIAPITEVVDDISLLANSDLPSIRLAGAQLLADVAREQPSACVPVIGTLVDSLERHSGSAAPDSLADYVDDRETQEAIQQHEQEDQEYGEYARHLVANVVVAVADEHPEAVVDHIETIADLAGTADATVRGAALDVLGAVAAESPSAVRPVADVAVRALDADESVLKARAIKVLGFLGDEQHVDALERAAAEAADEEIAQFADETASFIDQ